MRPGSRRASAKFARCPYRAVVNVGERTEARNAGAQCNIRARAERRGRPGLLAVVQALADKSGSVGVSVLSRAEMVVSPRKRFLREMERDKLQVSPSQAF